MFSRRLCSEKELFVVVVRLILVHERRFSIRQLPGSDAGFDGRVDSKSENESKTNMKRKQTVAPNK